MPSSPGQEERVQSPRSQRPASEPHLPATAPVTTRSATVGHESQTLRPVPLYAARLGTPLRSEAALHACAKCDSEQVIFNQYYFRETHRRRKCSTTLSTSSAAHRRVAPFATESLASSVTIPGEPLSVRRSALITSRPGGRATADVCCDCEQPDDDRRENHPESSYLSAIRKKEAAY